MESKKASAENYFLDVILCAFLIIIPAITCCFYTNDLPNVPVLVKIILGILISILSIRLIFFSKETPFHIMVISWIVVLANILFLIYMRG
jgi:Mn2+/Fe2+ NRAMP family transporter